MGAIVPPIEEDKGISFGFLKEWRKESKRVRQKRNKKEIEKQTKK